MPKDGGFNEGDVQTLDVYIQMHLAWRYFTNLDIIIKIEQEKWTNPTLRRQKRKYLRDAKAARICLILCLIEDEIELSEIIEVFRDKITGNDPENLSSKDRRREYDKNRKQVIRILWVLKEYGLVKVSRGSRAFSDPDHSTGIGKKALLRVEATPTLYQCLIKFIPNIEECWRALNKGGKQGVGTPNAYGVSSLAQSKRNSKPSQLSEYQRWVLHRYFKTLLVWRHFANFEAIKKIERNKWPDLKLRTQNRRYLRDAKSAVMCSLLCKSGEELVLSDFIELFKDKVTGKDPDKISSDDKRNEYDRNRKLVYRTLEYLAKYGLVKINEGSDAPRGADTNALHKVQAEPFLSQCIFEFIPFIEECWKSPEGE